MLKIIATILLVSGACVSSFFYLESRSKQEKLPALAAVGLVSLGLAVLINVFSIVPAGRSGVMVNMGRVSESALESGLHIKIPVAQKIVTIDNRVQRTDVEGGGASKDLQNVSANTSVNYHVLPANSATLYRNVGKEWETVIIRPAVQESMKAVMARFTAEELITKRQEVGALMLSGMTEKLSSYGIAVDSVNILNMDFSEQFNAAIEAKQTAQQNALKAEQDLARIQVEARQKVVEAQADADANHIRAASITKDILQSEFLDKWDGKLPVVMGDSGQILDISSILD